MRIPPDTASRAASRIARPGRARFGSVDVGEERGAREDHGHRVRHVLPVERRRSPVRGLGHEGARRVVVVERDEQRLGARDRAEERQDEVGEDVAIAIEGRDDERVARGADQEREGRVDQLWLVGNGGVAFRSGVHLLFQHPFVDGADRVLRALRRPWRSCARRGGRRTRRRPGRCVARCAPCGRRPPPRPRPRATPWRRRRRRQPSGRPRSGSALRRSGRRPGSGGRFGRSRARRSPPAGSGSGSRHRPCPPA